jgi:hypothetical protein
MVTPFELRKRVLLQVAWSQGYSIFGYRAASAAEEHTKTELVDLYRKLADFVMEQARGEQHA